MEILDTFFGSEVKKELDLLRLLYHKKTLFVLKHLVNCYKWIDVQLINTTNP